MEKKKFKLYKDAEVCMDIEGFYYGDGFLYIIEEGEEPLEEDDLYIEEPIEEGLEFYVFFSGDKWGNGFDKWSIGKDVDPMWAEWDGSEEMFMKWAEADFNNALSKEYVRKMLFEHRLYFNYCLVKLKIVKNENGEYELNRNTLYNYSIC